jgi:hypothetical protein
MAIRFGTGPISAVSFAAEDDVPATKVLRLNGLHEGRLVLHLQDFRHIGFATRIQSGRR